MMQCEPIYYATLSACTDIIFLKLGLEESALYVITLTDKHNIKYTFSYTTNDSGIIAIETNNYPAGLFNQHAGAFLLTIFKDNEEVMPIICNKEFNSISIQFVNTISEEEIQDKIGFCDE